MRLHDLPRLCMVLAGLLVAGAPSAQVVRTVVNHGPSDELYDIVILAEGYTAADQARFDADVLALVAHFQNDPLKFPYGAYFDLYNVHTVFRASNQRGADKPPLNVFVDTAYDASYWWGGIERCLYIGNTSLAALDAALAPDTDGRVMVLVNDSKYGGCAGSFSVAYNGSSGLEVQSHEWGHSFGQLADEYDYGSPGTYTGPEPGQANITADPTGARKWSAWLGYSGPIGTVAAYQGAGYYVAGLYRPEPDCQMRSLGQNFCTVCREQMIKRFHQECAMIGQPSPSPIATRRGGTVQVSFTNRLATRPHTVDWRVDGGPWQAGGASLTWNIGAATSGLHTIDVRLTDTSLDVRQDPARDLVHTHTWIVDVAPDVRDLGLGEFVPHGAATRDGDTSTAYPWNNAGGMRVMYAYGAAALRDVAPLRVRAVAFRPDGASTTLPSSTWDLTLDVSTGAHPPAALDRTFELNHGADRVRVHDGLVSANGQPLGTAPHPFVFLVEFGEPFTWNPRSGPLLLDFRLRGIAGGTGSIADAATAAGGEFARIAHTTDPNATTADFPASGSQPVALVAELILDANVTPAARMLTEGSTGTSLAFDSNQPQRLMSIHDGSTFGVGTRHRITGIAWRPDAGRAWPGGRSIDLRVELSTGAPNLASAASTTFDLNHGADRTVVFDGTITPPQSNPMSLAPFAIRIDFQRPFEFDPMTGALVVDLHVRRGFGGPGVPVDADLSASGLQTLWLPGDPEAPLALVGLPFAPVLALTSVPSPVLPESADGAPGGVSLSRPWGAPGPTRVMTAYDPSTLGVQEPVEITHLSWRAAAGPTSPTTFHARIDLSSGAALPLGTNFDLNHGPDRTTVFQGDFSAVRARSGEFGIEVKLDTPFRWDPANGPIVVDVRKDAEVGGGGAVQIDACAMPQVSFVAHTSDANATVADRPVAARGQVLRLGGAVGANALVTPYGAGCAGIAGVPVAGSLGLPWLGNRDFALAVFGARPNANATMLFGGAATNTPLGPFGAPGCTLLSDVAFGLITHLTDAAGVARSPAAVPNDPALAGAALYVQWVVVDPGRPGGVALSDGVRLELR